MKIEIRIYFIYLAMLSITLINGDTKNARSNNGKRQLEFGNYNENFPSSEAPQFADHNQIIGPYEFTYARNEANFYDAPENDINSNQASCGQNDHERAMQLSHRADSAQASLTRGVRKFDGSSALGDINCPSNSPELQQLQYQQTQRYFPQLIFVPIAPSSFPLAYSQPQPEERQQEQQLEQNTLANLENTGPHTFPPDAQTQASNVQAQQRALFTPATQHYPDTHFHPMHFVPNVNYFHQTSQKSHPVPSEKSQFQAPFRPSPFVGFSFESANYQRQDH